MIPPIIERISFLSFLSIHRLSTLLKLLVEIESLTWIHHMVWLLFKLSIVVISLIADRSHWILHLVIDDLLVVMICLLFRCTRISVILITASFLNPHWLSKLLLHSHFLITAIYHIWLPIIMIKRRAALCFRRMMHSTMCWFFFI